MPRERDVGNSKYIKRELVERSCCAKALGIEEYMVERIRRMANEERERKRIREKK